jgi:hypothetical protein
MFLYLKARRGIAAGRASALALGIVIMPIWAAPAVAQTGRPGQANPPAEEAPKEAPKKATAEDLKRLSGEIEKALKDLPIGAPEVSASVTTILNAVDQAQAKELQNIKVLADRIAAILGKTKPGDPGLTETLAVLRSAVEAAEAANTAEGIAARATRLKDSVGSTANATAVQIPATAAALDKLSTAIAKARQKYVVYVLSAWFGDDRFPNNPARQCNVTSQMREACLSAGGASCAPRSIVSKAIAEVTAVCGYDPVPFAPDEHKALSVLYACVANSEGNLQQLLGTGPKDLPNSRWATVRGDALLQCDIKSTAASTDANPSSPAPAADGAIDQQPNPKPGATPPAKK